MSLRLWTAALLAGLPAIILRHGAESPAGAFSWGFPLLVGCGGWLGYRASARERVDGMWLSLLALLFVVPAVGTRLWAEVLAQDLLIYVPPLDRIRVGVDQASICLRGLGVLLSVSGAALVILLGRASARMAGLLLGAAVGISLMELQLESASRALFERDGEEALRVTAWLPALGVGGALLGLLSGLAMHWKLSGRFERLDPWEAGGLASIAVVLAWLVRSPLPAMLPTVFAPESAGLPRGPAGLSVPIRALDPWKEDFLVRAVARGQSDGTAIWQCTGRTPARWLDFPRLSVALAIPGDRLVSELDPVLDQVFERGLHRVFLVGEASPESGPLRDVLSYPALPFVLEAPPAGAHWVRIGSGEHEWLFGGPPSGPDAICVVLPESSVSIDELYGVGRSLYEENGCAALALTPLEHRSRHMESLEEDPGCAEGVKSQGADEDGSVGDGLGGDGSG